MRSLETILVSASDTIRSALLKLERSGTGLLVLVDEAGVLLRTVTDGDLRRLLLAGSSLENRLDKLPAQEAKVLLGDVGPEGALRRMNELLVDQLPVIDENGCPVGLYLRRDVDTQILLSTPHMGSYEKGYVEEAFRTNWVAPLGPNVDAFERELAQYVGVGHAAALVSGTAAIHLALRLLGVRQGDTVFCSSLTFVASANPILYEGAVPVFIDSDYTTWNMSPAALESAFAAAVNCRKLPRAVIVVNLYGQSADYDPIREICARYRVPIIEDAAESLGASYKASASGTLGLIGTYSFNGNKIITTSGGGMLVSDNFELVQKARFLSTQSRDQAGHYEHSELGYNYRLSNVLAGIGRGQLKVIDARIAARRHVYERYVEGLEGFGSIEWMPEASFGTSTHWLTACLLERDTLTPLELIAALAAERIEARRIWKPMHLQPLYRDATFYSHCPGSDVASDLFARGVCLPSGSNMTEDQQSRIIEIIKHTITSRRRSANGTG